MIDLNHVTNLLLQRSAEVFPQCQHWSDSDWFLELVGEIGEAGNIIKKLNRGDANREQLQDKLSEEFSDILFCLLFNCAKHKINLELAATNKFNLDSIKRGTEIRLGNNIPVSSMRVFGLDMQQVYSLICYFRSRTGIENVISLLPSEIIKGQKDKDNVEESC
jgi:NTP pyrophosphatase (non-canonical NTP hydrolase)